MTPRGVSRRGAKGSRFRSFLSSVSIEFPDPETGPARGHVGGTGKTSIVGVFQGPSSPRQFDPQIQIPAAHLTPHIVQYRQEAFLTPEAGPLSRDIAAEKTGRDGESVSLFRLPLRVRKSPVM